MELDLYHVHFHTLDGESEYDIILDVVAPDLESVYNWANNELAHWYGDTTKIEDDEVGTVAWSSDGCQATEIDRVEKAAHMIVEGIDKKLYRVISTVTPLKKE